MKAFWFATAIALASAVGAALHAQTPPAAKPARVTVVGCVQPSPSQAPAGTTGTAGAVAPQTRYVLTTPPAESTSTKAAPAPASAMGTATAVPDIKYRFDSADNTKVSSYQGEKVQVVGTVEGEPAGQNPSGVQPTLKVDSIKIVSAVCTK